MTLHDRFQRSWNNNLEVLWLNSRFCSCYKSKADIDTGLAAYADALIKQAKTKQVERDNKDDNNAVGN